MYRKQKTWIDDIFKRKLWYRKLKTWIDDVFKRKEFINI